MTALVIIIGIISSFTLVMAGLSTQRKRMLLFSLCTTSLMGVQYALTGSTVALVICGVSLIRSTAALAGLKYQVFNTWPFLVTFLAANTAAFAFTANWGNIVIWELLPLLGAYLSTAALFFKRMVITKSILLSSSLLWIGYEIYAGVYGQLIGEAFNLVANVLALTALMKAEKAGIPEAEVENIDTHALDVLTGTIPVVKVHVKTAMIPIITNAIPVITHSLPKVQKIEELEPEKA